MTDADREAEIRADWDAEVDYTDTPADASMICSDILFLLRLLDEEREENKRLRYSMSQPAALKHEAMLQALAEVERLQKQLREAALRPMVMVMEERDRLRAERDRYREALDTARGALGGVPYMLEEGNKPYLDLGDGCRRFGLGWVVNVVQAYGVADAALTEGGEGNDG